MSILLLHQIIRCKIHCAINMKYENRFSRLLGKKKIIFYEQFENNR